MDWLLGPMELADDVLGISYGPLVFFQLSARVESFKIAVNVLKTVYLFSTYSQPNIVLSTNRDSTANSYIKRTSLYGSITIRSRFSFFVLV